MKYFEELYSPGLGIGSFIPSTLELNNEYNKSKTINLFSVDINNCSMQNALDSIINNAIKNKPANYAFVNADCLNKAWTDANYRDVLSRMTAVFADGIGVRLAAKMEKKQIVDNVNGTDMFPLLCQEAAKNNLKIFLLGSRAGTAEVCAQKMSSKTPNLIFAGTHHGYFDDADAQTVIDQINASGADILIVAFGAPLQECWMDKFRHQIKVPVCIGVGACLDFYSERIERAPKWLRNLSLEWVWRLVKEPKRMWRRYIIGNPLFLFRAWKWANLDIKMLPNKEQQVEQQAVNYFLNQGHDNILTKMSNALRVNIWQASISGSKIMKRATDVTVAATMLTMLSPLFLALGTVIKLESKGPVLFSQTRIGLDGKPFRFWKFRSMRSDAEQIKHQLSANAMSDGVRFKIKKDPRITKVGAFIRKYSIDELPQLWNVLIGDMSLVGPRPALPQEVAHYTLADKHRLNVVPGITGLWQVSGRSDIPFKQQVKLDVQYRRSQSMLEDFKLLFLTVPAVVLGKGAY